MAWIGTMILGALGIGAVCVIAKWLILPLVKSIIKIISGLFGV